MPIVKKGDQHLARCTIDGGLQSLRRRLDQLVCSAVSGGMSKTCEEEQACCKSLSPHIMATSEQSAPGAWGATEAGRLPQDGSRGELGLTFGHIGLPAPDLNSGSPA